MIDATDIKAHRTAFSLNKIDRAIVRKLFAETGTQWGTIYIQNGVNNLLRKLPAYNRSARFCPWLAFMRP